MLYLLRALYLCFSEKLPPFALAGFDLTTHKLQSPWAKTRLLDSAAQGNSKFIVSQLFG
jgi:hypothetical protein